MSVQPDEVIVGRHESGVLLEEGLKTGGRNYCSKCKNNIHCHVKVTGKEAEIVMTCSNDDCVCKCRTHYACKNYGRLHPYGKKCTCTEETPQRDPKADDEFDKLMNDWEGRKK